jgi:hypothetical protein
LFLTIGETTADMTDVAITNSGLNFERLKNGKKNEAEKIIEMENVSIKTRT